MSKGKADRVSWNRYGPTVVTDPLDPELAQARATIAKWEETGRKWRARIEEIDAALGAGWQEELVRLRDLERKLAEIAELHRPQKVRTVTRCTSCDEAWPCATAKLSWMRLRGGRRD